MRYAVCYDIGANSRRNRVAKILEDYGTRVQRSVFEADLDEAGVAAMTERLRSVVNIELDGVVVYALCAGCERSVVVLGRDDRSVRRQAIVL